MKNLLILICVLFFWSCSDSSDEQTPVINDEEVVDDSIDEEVVITPPVIQTPSPLIHLADNLDEQDSLGWCIDTVGRDFNSELHAHSCKPEGGDVQFYYNETTLQICSAEFPDFCIEMTGGPVGGMSLSLIESNTDSTDQKFIYNEESGEFSPEQDMSLCIAVGATSTDAGIYMSRSLTLEVSETTDVLLKKWVIVGTAPTSN